MIVEYHLRGYYTPNQILACFVLYLKIINTILENHIYASYSKSSKGEKKKKKKKAGQAFLSYESRPSKCCLYQ